MAVGRHALVVKGEGTITYGIRTVLMWGEAFRSFCSCQVGGSWLCFGLVDLCAGSGL